MHTSTGRRRRLTPSAREVEELFVTERDGETTHVSIPRPEIELIVRFGPPARDGIDAHVFGGRDRVHRKVLRGGQRTVSARLRLGTTTAVLGAPAPALVGRIVAIEDLWGNAAARRLFDRLAGAPDLLEAAAILDATIAERLATSNARCTNSPLALDAAGRLRTSNVNAVANDLGVSERHLRRIFRDTFGVGPKTFAKLARFDRAVRAAREDEGMGWATIAVNAGYYDQAHLIAEFRAIASATPRALLGELRAASSNG